jgi:hypothetical protein
LRLVFASLREKASYGVGVAVGFSAAFVALGAGGGTVSGATLRVGSGKAGAFRLLFVFALLFSFTFAFAFAAGVMSSMASGETAAFAFAFTLAFTFAGGLIVPPAGIPSSPFPVAGEAGCTG